MSAPSQVTVHGTFSQMLANKLAKKPTKDCTSTQAMDMITQLTAAQKN